MCFSTSRISSWTPAYRLTRLKRAKDTSPVGPLDAHHSKTLLAIYLQDCEEGGNEYAGADHYL